MLYLVAHSFLNGQSKNSNFFRYQSYTRRNLKKTVELWGRECQETKNSRHFDKSLQVEKRLVKGKGLEAESKLRNNHNSLTNTTNQENLLICLHKLRSRIKLASKVSYSITQ